ncbi:MAG: ribonuclease Z [Acidobacteria bacterium 13_1_20CM_3_53_8]|nr:MAG: ribonuclease Z [Acidobacteria bacterium 13_1_20CM_3_53_8]
MRITFLGTSSGVPTRSRNVSSLALRLPQRGEVWLFDCGEGTQHQIIRSDLSISRITRIFITHMHGDHVFGLMGLLATRGMAGAYLPVDIYAPPEIEDYFIAATRYTRTQFSYPVTVHAVKQGVIFEDEDFIVDSLPLKHRITSFGYRVTEKDFPGHFNPEKAAALGIPAGPLYGRLKRGETIQLDDGREVSGAELCGPLQPGRRIAYCTDTIYCDNSVKLAKNADLLIHEATFSERDEDLAYRGLHSTTRMAAKVALEANAKRLIITHFSPRYAMEASVTPEELLQEARAIFPATDMAHDFLTVDVARRNPPD